MKERSVAHATFTIERGYPKPPRRVFAALSDPVQQRRWFADDDKEFQVEKFEMDFRVGGTERSSFRVQGMDCVNDTVYLDIVPDRRIVIAYTMTLGGMALAVGILGDDRQVLGRLGERHSPQAATQAAVGRQYHPIPASGRSAGHGSARCANLASPQ